MCGIAGMIGREDASCDTLARMCDALVHRGPDDADLRVWEDHGGHLRADRCGAQTWALLLLEEWCRTNL